MENTRVALLGIVVEDTAATARLNALLHEYREYTVGWMGIPYHKKGISIISVAIDAPTDAISALSGKIGLLDGVSIKTVHSKI